MRRVTLALAAVIAMPLAGTATSLAASSKPGTPPTAATSSASASPTSTSSSGSPSSSASSSSSASPTPTTVAGHTAELTPLVLRLDSKGAIDRDALPDADELFTKAELGEAIPNLRATTADGDAITLDIAGETSDEHSSLLVTMKSAGKKEDVEKAWATHKQAHEARAKRLPGLYTFFGANQMGVADSFTDGTSTHVLLTNGDAAAEIWFSGIGFGTLESTHSASRADYTKTVVPKLVSLLGDKVALTSAQDKGHSAGSSATPSPSSSSSSSSPQSAASTSSTS